MEFPAPIAEALSETDTSQLPGTIAAPPVICQGAKFHSPRPLLLHELVLEDGRSVYLCGSCQDNLSVLRHLRFAKPNLDWEVKRSFGNQLRALLTWPRDEHDG